MASEGALKQYDFSSEPINARGWCLQEYFMSPRSLVFTSKTLRFRCRTAAQNVGNAIDLQDPMSEHQLPDILFHTALPPLERGSAEWRPLYSAWSDIVADYSRRAIGDPSDKLVACGAIAEAFQRALRSDYLAGLWRDSLLNDLLWQPQDGVRISRPAAFRAPSWSWASVDGEVVTWEAYSRGAPDVDAQWTAVAEVVRCEVVREVSGLPFGRVVGGSLVLRAAAIPCRLRAGDCEGCALVPAGPLGWYWEGAGEASESDGSVQSSDLPGWAFLDSIDDAGLEGMLAVPLFQRERRTESLLVALVDIDDSHTQSNKVYRRVGRFREIWTTGRLRGIGEGQFPLMDIEIV